MDYDILGLLLRWMHILAAIAAVGGSFFMRFTLMPSVSVLSDDQRKALHEQIRSRWAKVVWGSIAFLLVSGFINYFKIRELFIELSPAAKLPPLYNALFGIKFLLSIGIFFIASALAGRSPALAGIRKNAKFWMTLNLTLAVIVVGMAGVMRAMHVAPNPPATAPAISQAK